MDNFTSCVIFMKFDPPPSPSEYHRLRDAEGNMWARERDIKRRIKIITYEELHTSCCSLNSNNNMGI